MELIRPDRICPKCGKSFIYKKTIFSDYTSNSMTKSLFFHTTGFRAAACVFEMQKLVGKKTNVAQV